MLLIAGLLVFDCRSLHVGTDEQSTGRNQDSSVHRSAPRASGSDARNSSEQDATRGEHRPVGFEYTGRAHRAGHARAWSLPMGQSPCHGSGFYMTGINFEGPAPRPLERYRIVLADDGQILVDKSKKYQQEKGEWTDSESFVKV